MIEEVQLLLEALAFLHDVEGDRPQSVRDHPVEVRVAALGLLEEYGQDLPQVGDQGLLEHLGGTTVYLYVFLHLLKFHVGTELRQLIEEYNHVLVLTNLLHHKLVNLFITNSHRVHFTEFGQYLEQSAFILYKRIGITLILNLL